MRNVIDDYHVAESLVHTLYYCLLLVDMSCISPTACTHRDVSHNQAQDRALVEGGSQSPSW